MGARRREPRVADVVGLGEPPTRRARPEGFLERGPDGYRYVARGLLDAAVADLEQAYARYRTRIVGMIFE